MKTQIRILGTAEILLGAYIFWTFIRFYELTSFIQNEVATSMLIVGLFIAGLGLWSKRKIGWIATQFIGIHYFLSFMTGVIIGLKSANSENNFHAAYSIPFIVLIIGIGAGLFWINRKNWLDVFNISNQFRVMTVSMGLVISLTFLFWSYAK